MEEVRLWLGLLSCAIATSQLSLDRSWGSSQATRLESFSRWRHITREKGGERAWLRVGMRRHDDKKLEVLWRCVTVWRYWRTLSQVVYARANQVHREAMQTTTR